MPTKVSECRLLTVEQNDWLPINSTMANVPPERVQATPDRESVRRRVDRNPLQI